MKTKKPCLIYATYPSFEEAEHAAQMLIDRRLAAGINVISGIHSFYWWENRPTASQEVILIAKTIADHFEKINTLLSAHHSYSCPCILQVAIENGHAPFLEWIQTETTISPQE